MALRKACRPAKAVCHGAGPSFRSMCRSAPVSAAAQRTRRGAALVVRQVAPPFTMRGASPFSWGVREDSPCLRRIPRSRSARPARSPFAASKTSSRFTRSIDHGTVRRRLSPGFRTGLAAVRRGSDLHAVAGARVAGARRHGGRCDRRSLGRRHDQPARRPPWAPRPARRVHDDPPSQPGDGGRTIPHGAMRGSRRRAGQPRRPRRHAGTDHDLLPGSHAGRHRPALRRRRSSHEPADPARARRGRAPRHGAFRRPHRPLRQLFRRLSLHPRHALPPRHRGGASGPVARGPDRHSRDDL